MKNRRKEGRNEDREKFERIKYAFTQPIHHA